MSKYLKFIQVPFKGKTKRFHIVSKSSGDIIGKISWHSQWRQYTFAPAFPTIWNSSCLQDIETLLNVLMDERKSNKINNDWHDPRSPYYIDGVDK